MPIPTKTTARFSGLRKTEIVSLPSLEGSSVEVYTSLIVSEQREMQAKYPRPAELDEKQKTDMTMWLCIKAIKKWNLVDVNDKPLPVDEKTLDQFAITDLLAIMQVITGKKLLDANGRPITDEKKSSN